MAGAWRILSSALGAAVACALGILYLRLRRRRRELLARTAELLGVSFHGSSFRGRFRARAVRGDAVALLPRTPRAEVPSVLTAILQGGSGVLSEFRALARSASERWRVLRVRVELSCLAAGPPDPAAALAAVRRELEARFPAPGYWEVASAGSEVVFVLRARAASPELARELVGLAINASSTERAG